VKIEYEIYNLLITNKVRKLRKISKRLLASKPHDSLFFAFHEYLKKPTIRDFTSINKIGLEIVARMCIEGDEEMLLLDKCRYLLRRYT
jgi:hypothetical protein